MPPAISVILPYRDAATTLAEALDSVFAQRAVDAEVLAIDDGSTDASPRIARGFGRATQLSTGGRGLVAALNAGLAAARAPVVARMDADDVALPDRLHRQLAALAREPALAAVGSRVEAFPSAAVAGGMRRYVAWQNGLMTAEDHRRELFIESPLCHPSVAMRRDVVRTLGGYRATNGPEDYDLWLRIDAAGWQLAKLPDTLLRWRHVPGRATFADPRYATQRFVDAKAPYLARRLRALGRPLAIWGAGRTGKRLARALESVGVRADCFLDIAANKLGRTARGRPIVAADAFVAGAHSIVVAVSALGARDEIRAHLDARGLVEGNDYLCAA